MHSKLWYEITYPFLNFNSCTVEIWEWISDFISHFIIDVIWLSMLGLKLNHVSKRAPDQCPNVMSLVCCCYYLLRTSGPVKINWPNSCQHHVGHMTLTLNACCCQTDWLRFYCYLVISCLPVDLVSRFVVQGCNMGIWVPGHGMQKAKYI